MQTFTQIRNLYGLKEPSVSLSDITIVQESFNINKRRKTLEKLYESSNLGTLKVDGIKKLAAMIENDDVRFRDFPTWVLNSWIDPTKIGAIPLLDNKWLDVKTIVNSSTDIEAGDITFGGFVVDAQRHPESGVKAINLVKNDSVDLRKYASLLLFKRCVNEALKLIERRKKREHENVSNPEMNNQQ